MIEDQWSYKRPGSNFIHADIVFVAGYATRDSRTSRQTQSDRQICHGRLQPHQSSERHQHRNVESVGYKDSARQIRCADSSAWMATHSKSCGADNRKSTSVFRINLSHVGELAWAFCDAGICARYAHSKTSAAERNSLVEGFRAGEYPILVNCGSLPLPPRLRANLIPGTDQRSQPRALTSQTSIVIVARLMWS